MSEKTTTKTEAAAPAAGIEPVAKRATGDLGTVVPSAPTKHPHTNSFEFHFLTFLLITKNGEKQQRKPTPMNRLPGVNPWRNAQRAGLGELNRAPPRIRLNFIF
jgi:hypothetical protein